VIIGSGFAGLAAAIEAHDAGATVKIIEKMETPGGNSWINGGQVATAGSACRRSKASSIRPI
jgi:NADPH-dependent 2,4-dienoyl-CoA reductase/sulfur reductase-like enzyme